MSEKTAQIAGVGQVPVVQEKPHAPYPADTGHSTHGEIVAVQGVVGQCAGEIMPPVLPNGLIVDVAPAVQQDIFPGNVQFKVSGVVVAVGALFTPFKLHAMDVHVAVLRPPAGAHDVNARFLHGIIAFCGGMAFPPACGGPQEIPPVRPFRHLAEPGPHFIQVIRIHGQVHALV